GTPAPPIAASADRGPPALQEPVASRVARARCRRRDRPLPRSTLHLVTPGFLRGEQVSIRLLDELEGVFDLASQGCDPYRHGHGDHRVLELELGLLDELADLVRE